MFSGMDSFWSLVSRGMVEGQKAMLRSIDVLSHGLFLLDSYYQRYDGRSKERCRGQLMFSVMDSFS